MVQCFLIPWFSLDYFPVHFYSISSVEFRAMNQNGMVIIEDGSELMPKNWNWRQILPSNINKEHDDNT